MSSQSPQRNRVPTMQGSNSNTTPRDSTPSPSLRERQRAIKAHSLPVVPSVSQILSNQNQQPIYAQGQQPSPTTSNSSLQSRRSPPPTSRISPTTGKMSVATHPRERSPDRISTPPALVHSHSQPVLPQLVPLPPPGPQHSLSQPNVLPPTAQNQFHPRPIPRGPPPPFLAQYQGTEEQWQMTEQLMAEIERADLQQTQGQFSHPAGTSGVAYAGGAASNGLGIHLLNTINPSAKDPAVERVRVSDRASPKEQDAKRQKDAQPARESPKTRDRSQTMSSLEGHSSTTRTPEYRGSPQYQTPMASPGERTAAYGQYIQEGYQTGPAQGATPPSVPVRKHVPVSDASGARLTPPTSSKLAPSNQTPPLQNMASRPPDRSLPVQEEPEEDVPHYVDREPDYEDRHRGSPTTSSDVFQEGRYSERRELVRIDDSEDDVTLNEEVDEKRQHGKSSEESESGSGYTPRSPSTGLPERPRDGQYPGSQYPNGQYQNATEYQKTVRAKHRSGSTDQLGMRSLDPTLFETSMNSPRASGNERDSPTNPGGPRQPNPQPSQSQPQPKIQTQTQTQAQIQAQAQAQAHLEASRMQTEVARQYALNKMAEQRMAYAGIHPPQLFPSEDWSSLDDPTSSYLRAYLQTPGARPDAPVPPTPQSQTAAPTPSPLISAMHTEAEIRPIGSPYPYPFTHIRRSAGAQQAPSTAYDLNNPAVVREQLALQMQIYALNNNIGAQSDSTFSPPGTPFRGAGYNPWAYLPMMHGTGGHGGLGTSAMSIRSSPSHEPLPLDPAPPIRGRRREHGASKLRYSQGGENMARRVKPPPRVDSTQPRETSPEMSSESGEETAGEERFVDHYVGEAEAAAAVENGTWTNGNGNGKAQDGDDNGEWVDEEDEFEEEDLLDLEYHPTYVSNPQKRRRRWEVRWEALKQTFQALDRETDSTLILLASPPHSSKLHSLTSRSIRRDAGLRNSPKLTAMRKSFNTIAIQRRNARSERISLVERLLLSSGSASSADGSPGSEAREGDLRRALDAALGSLEEMGRIHDLREARWRTEMRQISEERDRVEMLLRQTLGPMIANGRQ